MNGWNSSSPPQIQIRPDAERYILEHGGKVFIRPSPRHGCCGGTAIVPVIDLGQPRIESDYQTLKRGDIIVHLHNDLVSSKSLVIGIGGFGRWRKLWIDGFQMTM